jgi:pyruvate, water dikinase
MDYVVSLDHVSKNDIKKVGGKGANIGEIMKMHIPIPQGFVVTTAAFDKLIDLYNLEHKIEQMLKITELEDTERLLQASAQIKEMILSCDMPEQIKSEVVEAYKTLVYYSNSDQGRSSDSYLLPLVAARSSATAEDLPTASFAGQQATFLNIKGEDELIEAVKKCWASLFEPRAIFYRAKQGFSKASIAVIVQTMIDSEKSGVMFTVDPTTGEKVVLIEAVWGLGESIVGGEVSPDSYKINTAFEIVDIQVSNKTMMRIPDYSKGTTIEVAVPQLKANEQVLAKEEIMDLVKYGMRLEQHYGLPQDIEFAISRGKIMILQTRAITSKAKVTRKLEIGNNYILKGIAASPGAASGKVKIIREKRDIAKIQRGDIIVTAMTSPDLVPSMSKSSAIITDLGGRTCHAAIVSREMGVPAIVGTEKATRVLNEGQEVTVDAYSGLVFLGKLEIATPQDEPTLESSITSTATKVKVNLAFPQRLEEIAPKADGVGLLRIEHLIAKSGVHPSKLVKEGSLEEYTRILIEGIKPIAKAFHPKPVWVRTLDARSDEFRNLEGGEHEPKEDNPMLGWHGIRRSLDEPELLKSEFRAIRKMTEEGLTNLQIMLPFVISTEEVRKAKEIAHKEGLPPSVKIGIMVETPASVMIIEDLCNEGISFASFGTNDLTQLTLGIDRNNSRLARFSSSFHPAVLRSMKQVIEICNKYEVETSICGESGSSPEMAKILVEYGIKSISCNIDAIDSIRGVVFQKEKELANITEG